MILQFQNLLHTASSLISRFKNDKIIKKRVLSAPQPSYDVYHRIHTIGDLGVNSLCVSAVAGQSVLVWILSFKKGKEVKKMVSGEKNPFFPQSNGQNYES